MLQLAGAVSGFGQGLQQGLQQTQQYMSQAMLLDERDKNERERMQLTFGHDEGMLQKRLAGERANNREQADLTNQYALNRQDQQNDFTASQARIERDFRRTQDAAAAQAALEKEIRDRGYKKEDAKTQAAEKIAEWKRDLVASDRKFQQEAGKDITLKTMDLQNPSRAGSAASDKLDPAIASRTKDLDLELNSLFDQKNGIMSNVVMRDDQKKTAMDNIDKKIAEVRNRKNQLLGQPQEPGPTSTRPPIRFPQ